MDYFQNTKGISQVWGPRGGGGVKQAVTQPIITAHHGPDSASSSKPRAPACSEHQKTRLPGNPGTEPCSTYVPLTAGWLPWGTEPERNREL